MKRILLALAPLFFLAACQDKSLSEPAAIVDAETIAGGVAFRLAEAERVVLAQTSDSLRVEAWRDGRMVSASGTLEQGVLVERLAEGPWTFKVAAYDRSGAIQWAGEGAAKVIPGRTVDLVVVLRKATGSVHVRIVLDTADIDPVPPSLPGDTLWNPMDTLGTLASPIPQTLVGAERMGPYVAIRTPYNCNATRPTLVRVVRPDGVVRLVLVNRGPMTKMMCATVYREQVLVYKPWSTTEQIVVEDLQGHVLRIPPVYPDPEDPNNGDQDFVAFSFQQGGGFTVDGASYSVQLLSTGRLIVTRTSAPRCDGEVCPAMLIVREDSLQLPKAALDSVRSALSDPKVAWPVPLTEPAPMCADAPWWNAKIAYVDGHVAYFDKPEPFCSDLPASYETVSRLAWSLIQRVGLI
jgi:hypothetical protein